ncbi:RibD family protein [Streptomyces sp. NPDC058326]|uniref:RibD family protein n=1 Tax=Streptomyces sp. NPDC058326 TaxID=3346447 RepID=UPI0036EE3905
MGSRPHVLLSVAVSLDGYIDDASPERLLLSNTADFARVDRLRADADAVLVGSGTLSADNPRLLVNDPALRAGRRESGRPEHPLKVTLTSRRRLDPDLRFWHTGGRKVVYTTDAARPELSRTLRDRADVVGTGPAVELGPLLDDLGARGVRRLMVEGGGTVHTRFLAEGLADEVHMAVAPLLVGHRSAPRFLNPAEFPGGPGRRLRLLGTTTLGDVVVLRYAAKESAR